MNPISRLEITPYLLAGGKAAHFGDDPRLLEVHGRPVLANLTILVRAALRRTPTFVGDHPLDLDFYDARWLPDAAHGAGPLGGLVSALRDCPTDWALILAADLPGLSLADLWTLMDEARDSVTVVALGLDDKPEPLIALYHTSTLPMWERMLENGRHSLDQGLEQQRVRTVMPASGQQALLNLSRPEDAARFFPRK